MAKYRNPALTVDIIIEKDSEIVLIKRKNDPFKGSWAIPGGFVDYGETVEHAAVREAFEETSLHVKLENLVGVYSDPNRDPRGHTVTIAYTASIKEGFLKADDDACDAEFISIDKLGSIPLAFDHNLILSDAMKYL